MKYTESLSADQKRFIDIMAEMAKDKCILLSYEDQQIIKKYCDKEITKNGNRQ